jgi:hypothetical protein
VIALLALVVLAGCVDDDEEASASGTGQAACQPVGEDLADQAAEQVTIQAREYAYAPTEEPFRPG